MINKVARRQLAGVGREGVLARRRALVLLRVCALTLVAIGLSSSPAWAGEVPRISEQPINTAVIEGQTAVFEAAATGSPTAQWDISTNGGKSFKEVPGAVNDQLTLTDVTPAQNGDVYRVIFTNGAGRVTSEDATLTVEQAPKVTQQPASTVVEEGASASFEAAASGVPAPTVQWEVSTNGGTSWSDVDGATAEKLTIPDTTRSENGEELRAQFTNVVGDAFTNAAVLTVQKVPAVTEQPQSTTVEEGSTVVLESSASGFPEPTVQWEVSKDGGDTWAAIAGATMDELAVAEVTVAISGQEYRAVFTNAAGKATSQAAKLTVAKTHYQALGWGGNSSGQLGDGNTLQSNLPITIGGLDFVTAVSGGMRHSLALLTDGSVMAWGSDASGQLGDGLGSASDVPEPVEGISDATAIAAGTNHSLALLSDGTVMAWGADEQGELGNGQEGEGSEVPVPVEDLTNVVAIAAGDEFSLALLSDGTVKAWGANERGELGDGKVANSDVPVAVKGLSGVKGIAAGGEHSLAVLSDGTVMGWGDDDYGQVGEQAATESERADQISEQPVAVPGISTAKAVAAGANHSLALLAGGTVMGWGEDAFGQLGDGQILTSQEAPVSVSGLVGASAIAAGGEHSMALVNGGVMAWGEARKGELGNGTAGEPSDVPVMVSGLSEIAGISAGAIQDLAFGEPVPSVTGVSPSNGSTGGGTQVTISGVNLSGATAVDFGATPATNVVVHSANTITATAPANAAGTVDVTVTTPAGSSQPTVADHFTYVVAATVTKLSAKGGPATGGTSVTITGTSFVGVTAVSFGSVPAASYTVNSPTSITAISPAETAGTVDVTVTTSGGTSATTTKDAFKVTPVVSVVAPDSGPPAGGGSVTVEGAGFSTAAGATAFKFGTKPAKIVSCSSTTSCSVQVPAGSAGTVNVLVTVAKAKSAANPPGDQYTYE